MYHVHSDTSGRAATTFLPYLARVVLNVNSPRYLNFRHSHYTGSHSEATRSIRIVQQSVVVTYMNPLSAQKLFRTYWTLCYLMQSVGTLWDNLTLYSNLMNLPISETKVGTLEIEPWYLQLYDKEKRKHTPTSTVDTSRGQVSCGAQAGKWKRTNF
jgi:hypothetical protein